jgi:hypothetical protein
VLEIGYFYKLYIKDNILSFGNLETILSASISLSLFDREVIIKAFRSVINVLDYSFDDDFIIG